MDRRLNGFYMINKFWEKILQAKPEKDILEFLGHSD
jgi:hypothetical protein